MKYYAHIEVEIEAESHDDASALADEIAMEVRDQFVFEVTDAWMVNVE